MQAGRPITVGEDNFRYCLHGCGVAAVSRSPWHTTRQAILIASPSYSLRDPAHQGPRTLAQGPSAGPQREQRSCRVLQLHGLCTVCSDRFQACYCDLCLHSMKSNSSSRVWIGPSISVMQLKLWGQNREKEFPSIWPLFGDSLRSHDILHIVCSCHHLYCTGR